MKAYVIEQPGDADVLQLRDIPSPEPTVGEVLIRVRAFGINRIDTALRAGRMGPITEPRVPGIEAVGEVIRDPSGKLSAGQRVATAMGGLQFTRNGTYAEQVTVLSNNVIALDDTTLPWEQLAALPEIYLTVWGALDKNLAIKKGQTLLVRGGTSAVGLAAITYAKARGLKVIATTRSAGNSQRLYQVGADIVVIDDGKIAPRIREIAPGGVDAALEVIGVVTLLDTLKAVRPFGGVSVVGGLGGTPNLEQFNLRGDMPGAVRLSLFPSSLLGTSDLPLEDTPLPWLVKEIAAKRIPSINSRTFAFDEVRQAHRLIESDRALGKIVVVL